MDPLRCGLPGGRPRVVGVDTSGHVRSYGARGGRLSALTLSRMAELAPRHGIPDGPLHPAVAFGRIEGGTATGDPAVIEKARHLFFRI